MKRLWPYLFILLTVLIFFRSFLFGGLLPVPSDTIIGLYHPFRDMYAKEFPRGIPFKNFLITDPVRQQVPWKSLAIEVEKKLTLPLWNPYSFAGYPLLANFQSGALYPLNAVFFIFPFSFAWSIFILLQPLLGGIFLYLYLRNLRLHPIAAVIGSISFAFSGFAIVWLEWGNIFHTLLWVPLVLLAKDNLLRKWTTKWTIIFFIAEVMAFFAGHVQLWFYTILLTNAYLFLRIYQKTLQNNKRRFVLRYIKNYLPFFMVGIGTFVVTSLQWLPTLEFILHSARNVDQNYLTTAGWFVPYQNLLQFFVPDFFGNPTTLNYWGVWNYAEFSGYIGMLPILFAFFAIIFRRDKKTWFFGFVCFISLLFALPTPLGVLPYQLRIPFLSTSQPTRLLGIVDLTLPILAALGCDYFIRQKTYKMLWICEAAIIGFVSLWIILFKIHLGLTSEQLNIAKRNLVFPSIFLFSGSLVIFVASVFRFKRWQFLFAVLVCLLTISDLFRFADKFTPFTQQSLLFPQEKLLSFLQKNIGNSRYMTTDDRIMAPNFSVMYHLQSVDGYDPLYLRNYAEYIASSERGGPNITPPFGFNRIITPHRYNSPFIDLLGVKYILTFDEIKDIQYKKVFEEGKTKIYENSHSLPRSFFAKNVIAANNSQDSINKLYQNQLQLKNNAVVLGTSLPNTFTSGQVQIVSYTPNEVILSTQDKGEGFLVLTDIYYPTWYAFIDGKPTKIYQTDYALRGIVVPSGHHAVVFSDTLF